MPFPLILPLRSNQINMAQVWVIAFCSIMTQDILPKTNQRCHQRISIISTWSPLKNNVPIKASLYQSGLKFCQLKSFSYQNTTKNTSKLVHCNMKVFLNCIKGTELVCQDMKSCHKGFSMGTSVSLAHMECYSEEKYVNKSPLTTFMLSSKI